MQWNTTTAFFNALRPMLLLPLLGVAAAVFIGVAKIAGIFKFRKSPHFKCPEFMKQDGNIGPALSEGYHKVRDCILHFASFHV